MAPDCDRTSKNKKHQNPHVEYDGKNTREIKMFRNYAISKLTFTLKVRFLTFLHLSLLSVLVGSLLVMELTEDGSLVEYHFVYHQIYLILML